MNAKITTKYILGIVALASLFGFAGAASASLSEYYTSRGLSLPPVAVRAETAAEVGIFNYKGTREQNILLEQRLKELEDQQEGNVLGYSVVSRYKTTLASSMTTSQTTVPVSSITTFDGHTLSMSDLGSKIYLTIEPGTAREEIVVCTAISSSQWSGCTRGLAFYGSSEIGVAANKKAHNAGSVVVMSNVHYAYENLVDKDSNEALEGIKTVSSTEFIFGQGVSTTLKLYFKNTASTSTSAYLRFANGQLGWSDNGTDTFTFAQGGSGLTASTTKGIGITDSKIHVNASSTRGFDYDANGELYLKDGSNSGIYFDSNGIAVERYDNFDWYGSHNFNGSLKASSTFESTDPLIVYNTITTSTLPNIKTDKIQPNLSSTTTVFGNVEVKGDFVYTGKFVSSTKIEWIPFGTDVCTSSCVAPTGTKAVILTETATEGGFTGGIEHTLIYGFKTTSNVSWPNSHAANEISCVASASWATNNTITNTRSCGAGIDNSGSTTAYFFK